MNKKDWGKKRTGRMVEVGEGGWGVFGVKNPHKLSGRQMNGSFFCLNCGKEGDMGEMEYTECEVINNKRK